MTITKYPQSCLKIQHNGQALLVDVGTIAMASYSVADFGDFDGVLFTHRHADHFDIAALPALCANGATLYGNADVAKAAGDIKIEVIDDGEELVIAGFKVKALNMEHCKMVDGSSGVPNTGYLIQDTLLLSGDSTDDPGISAKALALPIFGPDISLHDAFTLAQATGATTLIPVHYDVAEMNPAVFKRLASSSLEGKQIIALENGAQAELSV